MVAGERTGDLKNNLERLRRLLMKIKYDKHININRLCAGDISELLPIIHATLLGYSRSLARYLASNGYELYAKNDTKFIQGVYRVCREVFNYNPVLTPAQYLSSSFAERKLMFLCNLIKFAIQKHEDLDKKENPVQSRKKVPKKRRAKKAAAPGPVEALPLENEEEQEDDITIFNQQSASVNEEQPVMYYANDSDIEEVIGESTQAQPLPASDDKESDRESTADEKGFNKNLLSLDERLREIARRNAELASSLHRHQAQHAESSKSRLFEYHRDNELLVPSPDNDEDQQSYPELEDVSIQDVTDSYSEIEDEPQSAPIPHPQVLEQPPIMPKMSTSTTHSPIKGPSPGSIAQVLESMMKRMDQYEAKLEQIETVKARLTLLEGRMLFMEQKMDKLEEKQSLMNGRFFQPEDIDTAIANEMDSSDDSIHLKVGDFQPEPEIPVTAVAAKPFPMTQTNVSSVSDTRKFIENLTSRFKQTQDLLDSARRSSSFTQDF